MKHLVTLLLALSILAAPATAANHTVEPDSITGSGTVPGDFFYPVERFVEQIEIGIAGAPVIGSSELQAKARANNAEERLAEANELARRGENPGKVSELVDEYEREMNLATQGIAAENNSELSKKMVEISDKHTRVLQDVRQKVPSKAQEAIDRALERSQNTRNALKLPENSNGSPQRQPGEDRENTTENPPEFSGLGEKIGNSTGLSNNSVKNASANASNLSENLSGSESTEELVESSDETVEESENLESESSVKEDVEQSVSGLS